MLIYSPIKSPQSLIFFFLQIEIKIIWWLLLFLFSYRNIYSRKTKYRNVSFFQYRAALARVHIEPVFLCHSLDISL